MTVLDGSRYSRTYDIIDENGRKGLSRRITLDTMGTDASDLTYVTVVGDTLWSIAGQRAVYNDPNMWWVIADFNNFTNVFAGNFEQLTPGIQISYPTASRVAAFLTNNS